MKDELIVNSNPKSIISEGIKTLRTNLQFADIDKTMKTVLFTSSLPGEGKSFVASNLAVAFAQNGSKTLIVDADLRKGREHHIFNIKNDKGLSNLLIDDVEKNYKKYIKKTDIENLSIMTMGTIPPNPSELLNSEKTQILVNKLKEEYDMIIFDSVPVNGLTDALILSNYIDKTVIVCAIKVTPTDLLNKTKKSLQNVGADIAGIIVNKVPTDDSTYYNKYYSKYY